MTQSAKVKTFFLKFEVEAILELVIMPMQVCTLISYIFVVQTIQKKWFKVQTSLQQGTCVLYCGPITWANGSVRAKSGGHSSHLAGGHSIQGWNFAHKEQVVFEHRDCKSQVVM